MTVDRSVIAALEQAVDADPANAALAAHLASLLLEADRPQDALGLLAVIALVVAGASGSAADWELGDYVMIAAVPALTAVFGFYARKRLVRRGRWPF